ncbi:hamartin-like [Liolophura sinensis]|uniref:hamartin-like n=1 Tax=Liolophura sinensis TaxID=3198878 RepID=UPI003158FDD1
MAAVKGGTEGKDVTELFDLLESNDTQVVAEIKQLIQENLSSTRESWLLHSLLDYYYVSQSERTMEILAGVREPHDKHLFDKLNDGLKHAHHKLLTLRLLLFTVIKQPSWIHKLVHSSVFNNIIKCLKYDMDIPTLMTGVLVVTNYLPVEPVSITCHLNDIFDVFTRLLTFSKKKTGNIPDIFLLHLQVAVYALFHRLYGMFPCNFLAYLRHHFIKREHHDVYQEVFKPMIERVRLHPLLIIGSKEYESTPQRWRKMEIQDIVVDCAKMSLDVIEGTWEEVRCPIVAPRYNLYTQMVNRPSSTSSLPGQAVQTSLPPNVTGVPVVSTLSSVPSNVADTSVLWSPSAVCGLSTPPPCHMTSSQSGAADYTTSIQHSYHGTSYTNTPLLTPSQTPRATPPVIVDDLFDRSRNSRSNLSKRLSGSSLPSPKLQTCTSNLGQTSFDSQTSLSVPPSPLRPEFTSEPPLGTHRSQPLPRAVQKLPFDDIPEKSSRSDTSFSQNLSQKLDSSVLEKFQSLSRERIEESPIQGDSSDSGGDGKLKSQSYPSNLNSHAEPPGDRGRSLSIKVVDKVVQEMTECHDNADDADEEVREIIQEEISDKLSQSESTDKIEANLQLTAESVQRFMKKVNRIRFNSLTIGTTLDVVTDVGQRGGTRIRSLSCPQLQKAAPDQVQLAESKLLRCSSAAPPHNQLHKSQASNSDSCVPIVTNPYSINSAMTSERENLVSSCVTAAAPSIVQSSQCASNTELSSSLRISQGQTDPDLKTTETAIPLTRSEVEENAVIEQILPRPFDRILQYSLPYSAITRCQQCKRRYVTAIETNDLHTDRLPKADYETPLFSTFSPPELLDRHLQLGGEVHSKELSRIPITSQDSINWTHFGGLPPADEINILRGQILLIQNQVMYERHKRELHAKRNRRLLSKITHAKALEERNSALLDQLRLQENEIQNLQVSMKLLQQENQKLKGAKESDCYEQQVQLRSSLADNEELKYSVSELQSQIETLRLEKAEALKMLQQADYRLFNTLRDLQTLQGQAALTKELQDQISRLNKELMLMGELQQRYQEQLAVRHNQEPRVEEDYQVTSLQSEIKALKRQMDLKQVQITGMQKKVLELEETIKHKDITQTDLKRSLEMVKTSHQEEIKAVECKYQSSVKIGQQLESHIMDLYGQIETLKRASRQRGSIKVASEISLKGPGNQGSQDLDASSTVQNIYNSQSETLSQSGGNPGQKQSIEKPSLVEKADWPSSPLVARAATEPYPVLSQQLSSGSLVGPSSTAALLSQSDAFSLRGPLLNQSTEEESVPAQTIVMDIRHSPDTQRTQTCQRLNLIGSHPTDQSKSLLGPDRDAETDSSSTRSNTLCDSGVDSRS